MIKDIFDFKNKLEFNDSSSWEGVKIQNDFWKALEDKETWLNDVYASKACILVIKLANSFIKWSPVQLLELKKRIEFDHNSGILNSDKIEDMYAIVLVSLPSKVVEDVFFLDKERVVYTVPEIAQKCELKGYVIIKK